MSVSGLRDGHTRDQKSHVRDQAHGVNGHPQVRGRALPRDQLQAASAQLQAGYGQLQAAQAHVGLGQIQGE